MIFCSLAFSVSSCCPPLCRMPDIVSDGTDLDENGAAVHRPPVSRAYLCLCVTAPATLQRTSNAGVPSLAHNTFAHRGEESASLQHGPEIGASCEPASKKQK
eukprot:scaffold67300_cov67-Phaeocystis_antarctica.AAC.1